MPLRLPGMTATEFALYCRRIRECNDPATLARIRTELDRDYPTESESEALVLMATLKRVRLLDAN